MPDQMVEYHEDQNGYCRTSDIKLAFFTTRKGKKCKSAQIFGQMVRAEKPGSTKKRKQYIDDTINIDSDCLLRVFDKSTYGTGRGGLHTLMEEHVQEATNFQVGVEQYMTWLKGGRQ